MPTLPRHPPAQSFEVLLPTFPRPGGWRNFGREIDFHTEKSRETGKSPSDLVSRPKFYAEPRASSVGMIAAHLLAEAHGLPRLKDFWAAIGGGAQWSAAFESTFGQTADDFDLTYGESVLTN